MDLSGNFLGPKGGKALVAGIACSTSLKSVNLLHNNFDVETAKMLARVSKKKKITLCCIDSETRSADFSNFSLGYPQLRQDDIIFIAASMKFAKTLTFLDLSMNKVVDEGAVAVGRAMCDTHSKLQNLNLHRCGIDLTGAEALATGIAVSPFLTQVDLGENRLGR